MCILQTIWKFLDKKGGENYMSVLPDAVPFIYETREDEDSSIEVMCKKLIFKIQDIYGQEAVESYFE